MDNWDKQEVGIYFTIDGRTERLYIKEHAPNDQAKLEFELEVGGYLEVYFNDELAFKDQIRDPQ